MGSPLSWSCTRTASAARTASVLRRSILMKQDLAEAFAVVIKYAEDPNEPDFIGR
jgi:hypothetical protein